MTRTSAGLALCLPLCLAAWAGAAAPPAPAVFEPMSDADAWRAVPVQPPRLPAWARALSASLPRTTAHLLGMDHLHRERNPLGAALAARLRYEAADENGCAYARALAAHDLGRAGGGEAASKETKAAVRFARKMSRAAHTVTDEEVAELVALFGEAKVVAMVHTLAFANFQNRLYVGLGVFGDDRPAPPLDVRRDGDDPMKRLAPARPPWKEVLSAKVEGEPQDAPWQKRDFEDIRKSLEAQKQRKARIEMPPGDALAGMPPAVRERMKKIHWSHASLGYQRELTSAWFDSMDTFGREAELDRVFSSTLFWTVTRGVDCFY